ncbi:unnamed protein product [Cyprideis torosa]|uniref:Uncharacterized protein n=1 Tax=Cyprideis torosa TaxID=163714 RepID=A0A7R8W6E8_9CRUS|nr:unnamed protein product [Cyprideis torosa]CAG0880959.1 unnamed protein product [Cyprideis torosa]
MDYSDFLTPGVASGVVKRATSLPSLCVSPSGEGGGGGATRKRIRGQVFLSASDTSNRPQARYAVIDDGQLKIYPTSQFKKLQERIPLRGSGVGEIYHSDGSRRLRISKGKLTLGIVQPVDTSAFDSWKEVAQYWSRMPENPLSEDEDESSSPPKNHTGRLKHFQNVQRNGSKELVISTGDRSPGLRPCLRFPVEVGTVVVVMNDEDILKAAQAAHEQGSTVSIDNSLKMGAPVIHVTRSYQPMSVTIGGDPASGASTPSTMVPSPDFKEESTESSCQTESPVETQIPRAVAIVRPDSTKALIPYIDLTPTCTPTEERAPVGSSEGAVNAGPAPVASPEEDLSGSALTTPVSSSSNLSWQSWKGPLKYSLSSMSSGSRDDSELLSSAKFEGGRRRVSFADTVTEFREADRVNSSKETGDVDVMPVEEEESEEEEDEDDHWHSSEEEDEDLGIDVGERHFDVVPLDEVAKMRSRTPSPRSSFSVHSSFSASPRSSFSHHDQRPLFIPPPPSYQPDEEPPVDHKDRQEHITTPEKFIYEITEHFEPAKVLEYLSVDKAQEEGHSPQPLSPPPPTPSDVDVIQDPFSKKLAVMANEEALHVVMEALDENIIEYHRRESFGEKTVPSHVSKSVVHEDGGTDQAASTSSIDDEEVMDGAKRPKGALVDDTELYDNSSPLAFETVQERIRRLQQAQQQDVVISESEGASAGRQSTSPSNVCVKELVQQLNAEITAAKSDPQNAATLPNFYRPLSRSYSVRRERNLSHPVPMIPFGENLDPLSATIILHRRISTLQTLACMFRDGIRRRRLVGNHIEALSQLRPFGEAEPLRCDRTLNLLASQCLEIETEMMAEADRAIKFCEEQLEALQLLPDSQPYTGSADQSSTSQVPTRQRASSE